MKIENKHQQLLTDMLDEYSRGENSFPLIDAAGNTHYPVINKSGIVRSWDVKPGSPKGYRGLVLEINDHGNVTVWRAYKNGVLKEIASRV